jgi:hypothetical protein
MSFPEIKVKTPEWTEHFYKIPPVVMRQVTGLMENKTGMVGKNSQWEKMGSNPGKWGTVRSCISFSKVKKRHKPDNRGYIQNSSIL